MSRLMRLLSIFFLIVALGFLATSIPASFAAQSISLKSIGQLVALVGASWPVFDAYSLNDLAGPLVRGLRASNDLPAVVLPLALSFLCWFFGRLRLDKQANPPASSGLVPSRHEPHAREKGDQGASGVLGKG